MEHATHHKRTARYLLLVSCLLAAGASQAYAAEDITGEWEMTMNFGGRQSFATLSIAKNADGTLAGKWGSSELSNVRLDGGKLTFTRTVRMGDNEFTLNYTGALEDGKITGLMSSDRGEFEVNGARRKPLPPAAGVWDMSYSIGDRDVTGRLTIAQQADGALEGRWTSERGESTIANVKAQEGRLSFDRTSRFNDREMKSSFEGTVQGDKLAGVFKSERGEIPVTGARFGAALIGKWELTSTSDQGPRTRTLTVCPDLSGRYESFGGEIPIKDLKLEGNQVTFAVEMGFGDQTFRLDFKGQLEGQALQGEMTSPRGTNAMTGKRMMQAAPVVGTWEFTRETPQGTRTSTLKINPDLTGTYSMRDTDVPVTDLKVDGDQVSFKVVMRFGENEVPMEFKGKVEGTSLQGEFTTSRGTREAVGKKVN